MYHIWFLVLLGPLVYGLFLLKQILFFKITLMQIFLPLALGALAFQECLFIFLSSWNRLTALYHNLPYPPFLWFLDVRHQSLTLMKFKQYVINIGNTFSYIDYFFFRRLTVWYKIFNLAKDLHSPSRHTNMLSPSLWELNFKLYLPNEN